MQPINISQIFIGVFLLVVDGFIVKQANIELGLLTAQKEIDVENSGEAFFLTLLAGAHARYKKNSVIESSESYNRKLCLRN
ncbi:MAG: hypothetical protein ACE5DO_07965 [Desulfobacterales bacterium]